MKKHDVVIIGGGPGGSVLACYLARQGLDVVVIEREVFPRFHIGESLLPFSMDIFRELGFYPKLDSGKYIRKFGAQFIHHSEREEIYFDFATGMDADHPMAFEVPRDEFDGDLLEHAASFGAIVRQPEKVTSVEMSEGEVVVTTDREVYEARYIADCTGRDAFLGKKKKIRFPNLDLNNVGVFTHFTGVKRLEAGRSGDISIGMLPQQRWCWLIPFLGERTSVGVVCPSKELRQTDDLDKYLQASVSACPELAERMKGAERVAEIGMVSNYSHYCQGLVTDRSIMVGDAASFLDPIFSSGVHLAISMAKEASSLFVSALERRAPLGSDGNAERYEKFVQVGTRRFHSFIRMFYDDSFVQQMKKTRGLKHLRMAFTSVVAGDVWNETNPLFRTGVLG